MPETKGNNINPAVPTNSVAQQTHGAFIWSDTEDVALSMVQAREKLLMKTVTAQCMFQLQQQLYQRCQNKGHFFMKRS